MGRTYKQLSLDERCEIARLSGNGSSIRQIAAALDRPASTISRELKRNSGVQIGYRPSYANQQTRARRRKGARLERDESLRAAVIERLASGWSPEQIAGRLAREQGRKVISYESIYRFIYAQLRRTNDYSWRRYLPRGKSKRGRRGRKGGSPASFIEGRVSVAKRPREAADRKIPGHWEADLMMFAKYGQAILTLHERSSRLLIAARPPGKSSKPIARMIARLLTPLPQPCARASPSIMEPSSPATTTCTGTTSPPSSAIPTRPGRKAASKTPSDACAEPCRAKPTSPGSPPSISSNASRPTTTPRANALTGI